MRSRLPFVLLVAGPLLLACTEPAAVDPPAAAESDALLAGKPGELPRYRIEHLGSLGGTSSRGNAIANRGWVAGFSLRPGDAVREAVLWRDGQLVELRTLGGRHSTVPWAGVNNTGMVVGISETEETDSLGQVWSCTTFFFPLAPTGRQCLGFVWEGDEMRPLPTFGGQNGFATGVNNLGQVVGWAETTVRDPTCTAPQVMQFRAALWEPRRNRMQQLPPLPGDSASAATAINQRGQVVGISGDCGTAVGGFTARHAVLWENGRVTRLPDLGGDSWHTPMAINERGDVVGFSNVSDGPSGVYNARAFFWNRKHDIENLGTLPGNTFSQAHGINARGQVVGTSFGGTAAQRAFLWLGGDLIDLNRRVAGDYDGVLIDARDIAENGVITGSAIDASGEVVTFVATPVGG